MNVTGLRLRELPRWLQANVRPALVSAAAGGVVAWAANVWVMAVRYDGYVVPSGTPATGRGSLLTGALFWALATTVVFGVAGYWRAVGTKRFWVELTGIPAAIGELWRADGTAARVHFAWGAAVGLLLTVVIAPSTGLVLAIGFVAAGPTALGGILTSTISRLFSGVVARLSPGVRSAGSDFGAVAVGLLAGCASLVFGFVVSDRWVQLLAALALGGLAVAMARRRPLSAVAMLLAICTAGAALMVLYELRHARAAFADDGGFIECGSSWADWLRCAGSGRVRGLAGVGAAAGAAGGALGAFVGATVAGLPGPRGPLASGMSMAERDRQAVVGWVLGLLGDPAFQQWRTLHPEFTGDPYGAEFEMYMRWRHEQGLADPPLLLPSHQRLPTAVEEAEPEAEGPEAEGPEARAAEPEETAEQVEEVGPAEEVAAPVVAPLVDENGNEVIPNDQGLYPQYVDGEWRWVTRDEAAALIRDAMYWNHANELDRERALQEHEDWSDRQWDEFVDRCRASADADRANAAAERAEREWRLNTADRMATVALRNGYTDLVEWLDDHDLPTADQLAQLRGYIGGRMSDDAALSAYYDKQSDLEYFARGVQDDAAWVARQAGNAIAGPAGGSLAEWMVRNPETPLRIALAVGTGGLSEYPFLYRDITTALDEAAARKAAEQNLELTSGEVAWEVVKVGMWEIGGRAAGDVITDALGPRPRLTGEALENARRGADESGERFLQRVKDRLESGGGRPDLTERPMLFDGTRKPPPADDFVRNYLREGDEVPLNHLHETGLTTKQIENAGRVCREEGVIAAGRTTNMDSMRHIRDGTGVPKQADIKAKTIKDVDLYLNPELKETDKGLVGFFEPRPPDLTKVPAELRERVIARLDERVKEYAALKPDIDALQAKYTQSGGKLIDNATGQPVAGDWDLVMFKDAETGQIIGPGPRYDALKARWIDEVGGQHGAEVNVLEDVVGSTRPGTPEYEHLVEKAEGLKAKLQASHTGGKEVVVQVGPDGVLRRGPVGSDVNLYPEADDVFRDVATPSVPMVPAQPAPGPLRPPALPLEYRQPVAGAAVTLTSDVVKSALAQPPPPQ